MSVLCETLLALNLTLGLVCEPASDAQTATLPEEDKAVWAFKQPAPKPEPMAPAFPPVVIRQEPAPVPAPPPLPAPVIKTVFVKAEPEKPNPYQVALQYAFSKGNTSRGFSAVSGSGEAGKLELASLTPSTDKTDFPSANSQKRYGGKSKTSSFPVDNSRIIAADRYISGIMENGYNSQLDSASGGTVIIQTSRDIFGYHGRNILAPKGSRIICESGGLDKQGQTRVGLTCDRILIAGYRHEILQAGAVAGDVQGRAGITGEVDDQFRKKYGTAFLLAGISAAVRVATAAASSNSENSPLGNVADKGSEELSQKLGEISASVVESMVDLKSIVTISQGERVQIRPSQDWYIKMVGDSK